MLANIKAMNTQNISAEVICVGTAVKTSINDIVSAMNKKYGKSFKANYLAQRDGDIKESICDNSKIKDILDISKFYKFYEKILEI